MISVRNIPMECKSNTFLVVSSACLFMPSLFPLQHVIMSSFHSPQPRHDVGKLLYPISFHSSSFRYKLFLFPLRQVAIRFFSLFSMSLYHLNSLQLYHLNSLLRYTSLPLLFTMPMYLPSLSFSAYRHTPLSPIHLSLINLHFRMPL